MPLATRIDLGKNKKATNRTTSFSRSHNFKKQNVVNKIS